MLNTRTNKLDFYFNAKTAFTESTSQRINWLKFIVYKYPPKLKKFRKKIQKSLMPRQILFALERGNSQ